LGKGGGPIDREGEGYKRALNISSLPVSRRKVSKAFEKLVVYPGYFKGTWGGVGEGRKYRQGALMLGSRCMGRPLRGRGCMITAS